MPLDLSAVPVRPSVLAGEVLAVVSTLRNSGGETVRLPVAPELLFVAVPEKGHPLELSSAKYLTWLRRDEPAPPTPPMLRALEPGQTMAINDDLALYAHERLSPGKYRVHAVLHAGDQTAESEQFEVTVEPLRARLFSAAWEPARRMVAAHDQEQDDKTLVMVRAAQGDLPQDGTATRAVERSGKLESLAVAVNVSSADRYPWFALLEGGRPAFGRSGPKSLLGWVEGPALALGGGRLLTPGYKLKDRVLFAAVGEHGGSAQARMLSLGSAAVDTPLGVKLDKEIKASAPAAFAKSLPASVLPMLDAGATSLHLIWSEKAGSVSRVRQRAIKLAGGAGPEKVVVERERPLLAVSAAGVAGEDPPVVHALFGPAGKIRTVLYLRARLDGEGAPSEVELDPPDGNVDAWGVCVDDGGPRLVLAHSGAAIFVHLPERAGWTRVAGAGPGTSHLKVTRSRPGEIWAEWFDPQLGLRHQRIE